MHIVDAAKILRPTVSWNCSGDVYEGLRQAEPSDPSITTPTLEELQAVMNSNAYKDLRRTQYPPIADGLDALVHKEKGNPLPWAAYVNACQAIKDKYPKPQ